MKVLIKMSQKSREMKNVVNIKFLRVFFFQKIKAMFDCLEMFLLEKKVRSPIYITWELYEKKNLVFYY